MGRGDEQEVKVQAVSKGGVQWSGDDSWANESSSPPDPSPLALLLIS